MQIIEHYSWISFVCRTRHVHDSESESVITDHQARILDNLDHLEPISLTELAKRMGVTLSTMSLAVDRLEHLHLVLRARDPEDGRRLQLTLTEEGVRMKESHVVLDPERVRRVLERLSAEERGEVLRGLALLAKAAQRAMGSFQHGLGPSEFGGPPHGEEGALM